MGPPASAFSSQNALINHVVKVTNGGAFGAADELLISHRRDLPLDLDGLHRLALPVVQVQPREGLNREPVTPDAKDELVALLKELRFRQFGALATSNYIEGAGAHFLDVVGQEERLRDQRVTRQRWMLLSQRFGCKTGRQFAGIPDLESVGEYVDPGWRQPRRNRGGQRRSRWLLPRRAEDFVINGRGWPGGAGADGAVHL